MYSTGQDGYMKVHEIRDTRLHTVYESESLKGVRGASVQLRPVRTLAVHNKMAYIGDDGTNVKAVDWNKGAKLYTILATHTTCHTTCHTTLI